MTLPGGRRIDYVIDGAGRRIGRKVNGSLVQGFLYEDELRPAAQVDGSGNVISRFVYADADDRNVPAYMIKGGVNYRIVTDHGGPSSALGTNLGMLDMVDGVVCYSDFGTTFHHTRTIPGPPGFELP